MNYYELEPEDNHFHTVLADIAHRCNMACANCYLPNRDIPDMDLDKYVKFISRLPKRTDLRLIGGEPTINPQLCEFISITRKLGHRPSIATNGLRLASYDYAKSLWDAGLRNMAISMNGIDDDDIYETLDCMRCAKKKVAAMTNALDIGFNVGWNIILAKGVNEDAPRRALKLFEELATGRPDKTYLHAFRFKNIGKVGRYAEPYMLTKDELLQIIAEQFGVTPEFITEHNNVDGFVQNYTYIFPYQTTKGKIWIKTTHWGSDDGLVDPDSNRRGRITQDFKIAPATEHVKLNEFGY